MSEDSHGLNKAARLEAQREAEDTDSPPLDPKFPFEIVAFDPEFWDNLSVSRQSGQV